MKKTLQISSFCLWALLLISAVGFAQNPLQENSTRNSARVKNPHGDNIENIQDNRYQNPIQVKEVINPASIQRKLNSMTDFQEKVRNASKARNASVNGPQFRSGTRPDFDKSHQVTFNVNMDGAVAEGGVVFNPEIHQVYITGSFTGWAMPGSEMSHQMLPVEKSEFRNPEKDPLIYSVTITLEEGSHQYKYFLVESEPTWVLGEWSGDPNRLINVDGDMVVNNDWGILGDPDPGPHLVAFNVTDSDYNPIENAVITIYPLADPDKAFIPMVKDRKNPMPDFEKNSNADKDIFSISGSSEASLPAIRFNDQKDGEWIHWDSGINYQGIGLGAGGIFFVASRWTTDDLVPYDGMALTMLQIYIKNLPTSATIKVWQGADALSLVEHVSQPVNPIYEDSWQIIQLSNPYVIDVNQELWFGYEINDPGPGAFPAGIDDSTDYPGKGDKVKLGYDGNWENLSGYGIPGDWNIQAFVTSEESIVLVTDAAGQASFEALNGSYYYTVTKPGFVQHNGTFLVEGFDQGLYIILYEDSGLNSVTFNVNMTNALDFNPDEHSVYLTGSFTGWAEPGTFGSVEMTLIAGGDRDSPPFNFFDNFDGYEDFSTDLIPWTTYMFNTGNTWGAGEFDFPGEGTAFAFMAFNPGMTTPPINYDHPAANGTKYLVAIQSQIVNDDKWLISPELSFHESSQLNFMAKSYTAEYGLERIRVLVSTTGMETSDFIQISEGSFLEVPTNWTEFSFDLGTFAGETGYIAIQYVSYDAFIFMLDAFSVTSDVDALIYTATLELSNGQHQYKYFSDAYGPGWAGGEWQGDPNRIVEVNEDMVINDIWSFYQPSEAGLKFNLPMANQTYEVGVDMVIPVQIQLTGNSEAYFYMFLTGNDYYEYFIDGYISQAGLYDFTYNINSFIPGGTYSFIMEYYLYDTGTWNYTSSNSFTIINNTTAVEVVQPWPGDIWFSGNGNYITWNSLNVNSVNIYYSLNNGQNWEVVATNVTSYNGYDSWGYNWFWWLVPPGIEGLNNQSLIRIEDSSNPSVVGYSEHFTIMPAPIRFNTPIPGQIYEVGVDEFIPIEIELTQNYTVEYYLIIDINGNWTDFDYNYVTGPGIYNHNFEIPDVLPPGNYNFYLEFYIYDNGSWGLIQSNYFTIINNNAAIEVKYPMEYDVWIAGGWYEIRWNSLNVSNVNIYYSINNGAEWNSIAQSVPSYDGYYYWGANGYYWQVPAHIEGTNPQSMIKIESIANSSVFGLSDLFTITGAPVTFINPVSSTVLAAGDPLPIILDVNLGSYLDIYIIDPNYYWYWITYDYANAGIFTYNYLNTSWMAPGQYQVFVYHSYADFPAFSDYFTVVPSGTVYNVTFNLDMSNAQEFDPDGHQVYLTGDFLNWAVPGSAGSAELNLSDPENMIYSKAMSLKPGLRYYKYFSDAYGQGWTGGEWDGAPNRMIQVSGDMVVNDIWGAHALVFFNLELQSDPPGAGILSGSGTYNAHQAIELTATAHDGYVFVDWEDIHGNVISLDEIYTYLMPAKHTTLIAKFEIITKVEDVFAFDVKLFPNPASHKVSIAAEALIQKITIADITGKKVFSETVNNHEFVVNTEVFENGIYIVRIYTQQGIMVRKLIVNK